MKKEQQEENRMFKFMIDCKLAKAGFTPLFDKSVELNDECITVLESIPDWTWNFTPEEVNAIL